MVNNKNNSLEYFNNEDILFMVKFGKKQHLQQIVDGQLRFTPSQIYVEMEQQLHEKGQGDLLEGKMKIKCESLKIYDSKTNEFVGELHNQAVLINIQNTNNMPIFCLTIGSKKDCNFYENSNKYTIKFNKEITETIKNDFKNANAALIILEPYKFITDVHNSFKCVTSPIRYYDYDLQSIQQYMYLTNGNEDIVSQSAMSYDNRYRHLLCKDISFKNQREYRIIKLDELIDNEKFYEFNFMSKYLMVDIDNFFCGVNIEL